MKMAEDFLAMEAITGGMFIQYPILSYSTVRGVEKLIQSIGRLFAGLPT
jgi:hypothetical protein